MEFIKNFFKILFNWLWQCHKKNCNGRIRHIWYDIIGKYNTEINIYECDKCKKQYC